jgi:hypothetical protein
MLTILAYTGLLIGALGFTVVLYFGLLKTKLI